MIDSGTLLQERFLIEDQIGKGGMGAVYRAIDQKFGSQVAIKQTFYGDIELAKAFEREARLLNGLHHPILPHVSDYFSENGDHFLVMEYIEGDDLSELLKRGERFSVNTVLSWTLDLLDGLDYLHSQEPPVIHRDIKPHNMKLTPRGKIMLLDFGMAKITSANTLGTKSVFGYSRRYSPLEQIEGTGTDARADIFSLGASVYHLLTGEPPADVLKRVSTIVAGRPDPLVASRSVNADIPEGVSEILSTALALNAEHRFVSARAMWNALEYSIDAGVAQHNREAGIADVGELTQAATTGGWVASSAAHVAEPTPPATAGGLTTSAAAEVALSRQQIDEAQRLTPDEATHPVTTTALPVENEVPFRSEATPLGSGLESQNLKRRLRSAIPVSIARVRIRRPSWHSRPRKWLPILAACLVVALLGIYLASRTGEDLIGENEPNVAPTVSETSDVNATSNSVDRVDAEQPAEAEQSAQSETRDTRNQTPDRVMANPGPSRQTRDESSDPETKVKREAQPAMSDRRINNRQTGAERVKPEPRRRVVEPAFAQPSVSSIEAIMTGVPYERRNRWADQRDLWTEEELRRRQMRRIIRENRRRQQQPF